MFFWRILQNFSYVLGCFVILSMTIIAQDKIIVLEDLLQDTSQTLDPSLTRGFRKCHYIKKLPAILSKAGDYKLDQDLFWDGQGCAIKITSPGVILNFEKKVLRIANQPGTQGICVTDIACPKDPVIIKNFTLILQNAAPVRKVKLEDEQICAFRIQNSNGVILENGKVENFVCAFNIKNSSHICKSNISISGNNDFNKAFIDRYKKADKLDLSYFSDITPSSSAIVVQNVTVYNAQTITVTAVPTAINIMNANDLIIQNSSFAALQVACVTLNTILAQYLNNQFNTISSLLITTFTSVVIACSQSTNSGNSFSGGRFGALLGGSPFLKPGTNEEMKDVVYDDCTFINTGSSGIIFSNEIPQEFAIAAVNIPSITTNNNTFSSMNSNDAKAFLKSKIKKMKAKKERKHEKKGRRPKILESQTSVTISNSTFIVTDEIVK